MAFLLKKTPSPPKPAGTAGTGNIYLQQWVHCKTAARLVPATTTDQIFRVRVGRVLVHLLISTATVIFDATDPGLSYAAKALSNANAVIGTGVTLASTTNLASLEVGGSAIVIGSGAAFIKNNAGAGVMSLGRNSFVVPQGEIYLNTTGTNLTGFLQHDIWYQPLDEGAYVDPTSVAAAAI